MGKKYKVAFFLFLSIAAALLALLYLKEIPIAVLNPKGMIALKERKLFIIVTLLMLIVVIPTFILTFFFIWKYREGNTKAKYTPDWDRQPIAELIWWGIPFAIVLVIGVLCWKGCRELDPFKPLVSTLKPLKIQVVALQWKWLFIYPEQNIATVNFMQIPEETPIDFEITSDAPMNSFWIPELGGQIYAMPGMRSRLHLLANTAGSFRGSSANLSGVGFSGMTFTVKASSEEEFSVWVDAVKQSQSSLDLEEYKKLAAPSENNPLAYYVLTDEDLFNQVIMKYMGPS